MHPRYRPRLGHVVLIESSITDPELGPITGTVVRRAGGGVLLEVPPGANLPPTGSRVVAAHFAPEAMYRLTATATRAHGWVLLDECCHLQTVQRRQWPRTPLAVPLALMGIGGVEAHSVRGETRDLSIGGARVRTRARLSGSGDLRAALSVPNGRGLMLTARALDSSVEGCGYEYRLAFRDLDERDMGCLAALVRSASSPAHPTS